MFNFFITPRYDLLSMEVENRGLQPSIQQKPHCCYVEGRALGSVTRQASCSRA